MCAVQVRLTTGPDLSGHRQRDGSTPLNPWTIPPGQADTNRHRAHATSPPRVRIEEHVLGVWKCGERAGLEVLDQTGREVENGLHKIDSLNKPGLSWKLLGRLVFTCPACSGRLMGHLKELPGKLDIPDKVAGER